MPVAQSKRVSGRIQNHDFRRAALAYLARTCTEATNADLAPLLGVSLPENVSNLTRRFRRWLETDRGAREQHYVIVSTLKAKQTANNLNPDLRTALVDESFFSNGYALFKDSGCRTQTP